MKLSMVLSALAGAAISSDAVAQAWDGGGANNNWSTANNWNPNGVPVNDGTADVAFAGSTRLAPVVNGPVHVRSILFISAGAFDINPGGNRFFLEVGAGGVLNRDNSLQTISNPIELTAAQTWEARTGPLSVHAVDGQGHTLTIDGGFDTTIGRHAGSSSPLVKQGAGTLFLTSNATSSGGLTIHDGTVSIDDDARLGGHDVVIHGGTLEATAGLTTSRNITLTTLGASLDAGFQLAIEGGLLAVNGGNVASGSGVLGLAGGSNGVAIVNGVNSNWTMIADLAVGYQGQGTLAIEAAGSATNFNNAHIGSLPGSVGVVTVTGAGSAWLSGNFLGVGYDGTGTLNIEDGGFVSSNSCFVGTEPGSIGVVHVFGAGSAWNVTGSPVIGEHGMGTLDISDGGQASGSGAFVGRFADGAGGVNVTDPGSTWTLDGQLLVGASGAGTMTISNGGEVSSTSYAQIGEGTDAMGAVTVTGAGSTWSVGGVLYVGFTGDGTLLIDDGAIISDAEGSIAGFETSESQATVRNGASWIHSGELIVGDGGHGMLTIESGGTVEDTNASIGVLVDGVGTAVVSGTGSTWFNDHISVGHLSGTGSLTVRDGGRISSSNDTIGSSGTGTATVTGAGSRWDIAGALSIGFLGTGSLLLEDGADMSASFMLIGFGAGAVGDVTIAGEGTTCTVGSELHMCTEGSASTLNINGGMVTVGGNIVDLGPGMSSLTLDGGTLDMQGHAIGAGSPIDALALRSGTLRNVTGINGGTGLTKTGPGTLVLDTANSYAGPTAASDGTLRVTNATGSATGTGAVGVAPGATLAGTGRISGSVSNSGSVSPGVSPGILTLAGGYAQNASGALDVEIGGRTAGSQHDRLVITGAASLDGALNITLIDGFEPVVGDSFDILGATSRNGAFASVNAPPLPSPKVWRVDYLPAGVILRVACPADFDGNGVLNVFDFLSFQNAFSTGDLAADFTGDGVLNVFDFLMFQTGFGDGC